MQQYLHNDFATSQPLVLRAPTPALSRRAGYHMESQVPSPNMEAKSQLLSLKEPHWMRILVLLCTHICRQDLCWELGLAYCSTQFSTQVSNLTSNKQCHVVIHVILLRLRTWDLLWSGKSQLSCSPRLRFHRLTKSDMGLRTSYPHVNRSLTPNFASLWEGCFECISLINKFWG